MLKIDNRAPEFCLPNQDSEEICLRDFVGTWVVLYFYPKDNTPGCTTEALDFTALKSKFEKEGATIFGVSPDSAKKHCNFIAKKELTVTLLSDEEKEVAKAYDVWQLKKLYGREYMGIIRSTFLIDPDGKIVYIWSKVKVKGHAQEALEKLKELKANYNK